MRRSLFSSRFAVFVSILLFAGLIGCRNERLERQQKATAEDLLAMAQAVGHGEEPPPLLEDPERYGKCDELVRFMHQQYSRSHALGKELASLLKESETWSEPALWKDRAGIHAYRGKAERLQAVLTELRNLTEETVGAKGKARIAAVKLGYRFQKGFEEGLAQTAEFRRLEDELLDAMMEWSDRIVELLTLADEKLVRMDGTNPLFADGSEAERYRSLVRRVGEEKVKMREPARRFLQAHVEAMKNLQEKSEALSTK